MDKKIRMYSTNWCGDCRRAKSFLEAKGIAYEEINIEHDEAAARLVMEHNDGKRRVPTFDIDGDFYGNPRIDRLAEALGVSLW